MALQDDIKIGKTIMLNKHCVSNLHPLTNEKFLGFVLCIVLSQGLKSDSCEELCLDLLQRRKTPIEFKKKQELLKVKSSCFFFTHVISTFLIHNNLTLSLL